MDGPPYAPRQPPDKRNAAYEDIFGRPGASHHALPPGPPYSQLYQPDKRTSYSSLPPSFHNQPPYRQNFYPQPPQPYPQHIPGAYGYPNPASRHPSSLPRSRSIISHAPSNSAPFRPEDRPDEVLLPNGMTPAQAYQAQIYQNGAVPRYQPSPGSSSRPSSIQNGGPSRLADPPRLGVSLDHDDGRLGIDFIVASSDQGTDDDSELPWARNEHSPNSAPPSPQQSTRFSDPVPYSIYSEPEQAPSVRSSVASSSPSFGESATMIDHQSMVSRRSSDSVRTMPKFSGARRDRVPQDRSMSMSAATVSVRSIIDQKRLSRPPGPPSVHGGRSSPASIHPVRKTPIVYPALLSRVAEAFRDRIPLTDRVKDGLTYKDSFDGREAVDKIAYIVKTTDRNLALLLGRALDAQKFFHDVTYDHRLRDSSNELYQFQTKLPSPFVSGEIPNAEDGAQQNQDWDLPSPIGAESSAEERSDVTPPDVQPRPRKGSITSDDIPLPSGVFTLLTDCYSPTCTRDSLCYSIACPRRLEQQSRLNMKPQPGLSKQISRESLGDIAEPGTLWIHSVPQEIVNSVSDAEKRRQEAINEVIYTERDFVRDMEYLRDTWLGRLKDSDVIPPERKTDFLEQVFWNLRDIIAVNTRLRDALNKRQKSYAVVERIGDILLENVPHFAPFVKYGAHQLYGKYEFEKEKNSNPAFAQFVETTERLPESRKLELNAYLTKPTTRLARYPLLLEAVLKQTPEDSPDKTTLPKVIVIVREFLKKVNEESGKTENRFNLMQLEQQLYFKPTDEHVDLRLAQEGRQLVAKDTFNKRDGDIQVYLFDHAILFTKPSSKSKQHEQLRVYRRPIPLELLLISAPEDAAHNANRKGGRALVKRNSFNRDRVSATGVPAVVAKPDAKGQNWINFMLLGKKYYNLVLWAPTPVLHKKWIDLIVKQQQLMRERSLIFDTVILSDGFFYGPNKVNCAAPFNGGRKVVYGTNDGVYISDLRETNREPTKVLALLDVSQVDVLEDYQLLIVLSERQVITFPLDALDPNDPSAGLKRAKRISSHTSFFKAGFCLGRVLVCIVKSSQLSSTFKTLEPIDQNIRGRAKPTFRKLLQGGNDTLKLFREFYIPVESTSIHYLKTKMCVGCSKGFEIVDLESLDTQGLLDPSDESLEFVRRREAILRPMAIYRIHNEFLLCYDEFAFYVNKNGRRSRRDFMVHWQGTPTGFALHEPYVLAFEPSFVEIRHIETGSLSQVIQGSNLRLLFADTPPSVTNTVSPVYPYPPMGYDHQNPYAPPPQPGYGGYGAHYGQYPQYPAARNPQGIGRDEILIVSDDRVLALRTTAGPQRQMSDTASMMTMPR